MAKKKRSVSLEAREAKLAAELYKIRDAIEDENIKARKAHIRSLIGSRLKYRNNYSIDESWWLYKTITGVTPGGHAIESHFQTDCYGKVTIELNSISHGYGRTLEKAGWAPCDEKEYQRELEKMKTALKDLE